MNRKEKFMISRWDLEDKVLDFAIFIQQAKQHSKEGVNQEYTAMMSMKT